MRRIVGIQVRKGLAAGVLGLGALCLPGDVRLRGFAFDQAAAVDTKPVARDATAQTVPIGDQNRVAAAHPEDQNASASDQSSDQSSIKPGPAAQNNFAQNNEVAAEQQASQTARTFSTSKDPHTRLIVISIPDRQLALLEDGELVKVYPIAVGAKHSPSREGEYTVINHSVNPTYRHKDKTIEPGKDNPLGTRWMGLSLKGYGIHGTNVQSSVGKAVSHGCFRMKKKDVEELYELVQVGDAVSVRGTRDELTAQLFAAPAEKVAAKNEMPASAAGASKTEAEIASAAQNAAGTGGGGQ